MPHKRAKRSVREEEKRAKGADLVPSQSHYSIEKEAIPKSISRVLNAAVLHEEYNKKRKRTNGEDGEERDGKKRRKTKDATDTEEMKIKPGESITQFNRRVEDTMRSKIRTAVQAGQAHARRHNTVQKASTAQGNADTQGSKTKSNEKDPKSSEPKNGKDKLSSSKEPVKTVTNSESSSGTKKKTEFDTISSQLPKRLNDVVDAPPDLDGLLKKKSAGSKKDDKGAAFGKKDIVPPEQRRMMEIEREKAIKRYRELKEQRSRG
ncbi:hypothetical protein CPB86DRAFT_781654 [Serendipita vermifera]|nr:hypothetical protein CPB86DRAFT_781654 [Serendipita vermifera]